jgi:hypothetical protein
MYFDRMRRVRRSTLIAELSMDLVSTELASMDLEKFP